MISNWSKIDNTLYKKFIFKNFSEAFAFMTRVALISETLNHHTTWKNTWNVVEIWLSTHDAGNTVTPTDILLSEMIDELFN